MAMGACAATAAPEGDHVNLNDPALALDVRVAKAKALATDKDPKAIDTLLSGLDTRSEDLRATVLASLQAQKADAVLLGRAADVKKKAAERVAALTGLRLMKPEKAGAKVALLLVDKDESVREAAAWALCVFGTAEAERPLADALAKEPSPKVRYFLAVALGDLKTPTAQSAIAARAKVEKDFAVKDALDQAAAKQNR